VINKRPPKGGKTGHYFIINEHPSTYLLVAYRDVATTADRNYVLLIQANQPPSELREAV